MVRLAEIKGKRVAIVDDNESALKLTEIYCRESGMNIAFRTDRAEKLLAWLSGEKDMPEIILVDLMLPQMNGIALAKLLREDKKYSSVKLIAVTSDIRPGAAGDSQQAGFDAYLPKPVIRKELIGVIQTVLGDKRDEKNIVTRHTTEELSLKGVKVLVVEDKMTNQKLIKIYLDMFGCASDYADSGEESVEKIRNNAYDICLMDIQMPGMSGIEAAEIIRREINKDIPIIALTAAAMKEDKEKSLASGMNDYLMKPIDHNKLKEMLLKWAKV